MVDTAPKTDEEIKLTGKYFYACGRRKRATARVRLYDGSGKMVVNSKNYQDYFSTEEMENILLAPLEAVGLSKKFDVSIKIAGGGLKAQAEACRHGISRALLVFDENFRATLKPLGFLKRDDRKAERKKPGLKGARKGRQFSKR